MGHVLFSLMFHSSAIAILDYLITTLLHVLVENYLLLEVPLLNLRETGQSMTRHIIFI